MVCWVSNPHLSHAKQTPYLLQNLTRTVLIHVEKMYYERVDMKTQTEWIKKLQSIYTLEYYNVRIKINTIQISAALM